MNLETSPARALRIALTLMALALLPRAGLAEEVLQLATDGRPGGGLAMALRAEPRTFNPVLATDNPSVTIIRRLMADLVHIHRADQTTEPALAKHWQISQDGLTYRLELRRGLRFSDGHPFDADDVLFTFRVYLDEAVGSPNRDLLIVAGKPIEARKLDPHTVEIHLAEPYAVGERLFDSIAILPEHLLQEAYRQGRFAQTWGVGTPPAEIAGLGPFRLKQYLPGDRVVLERNPHYWKVDRKGQRLPYLQELTFLFVADLEAQSLRFQSGDLHLIDGLSAASFDQLTSRRRPEHRLEDLGPGLLTHFLFFNLNNLDNRPLPDLRRKQKWFRSKAFRQAISAAIDRQGIARLVYRGRATPILAPDPPGNKLWRHDGLPRPRQSLDEARRLLSEAGFSWNEKGQLQDAEEQTVKFSLITNSSNSERVRMATIIQDDLRQLGLQVTATPLEFQSMVSRVLETRDYEACLLGLTGGDVDPNSMINVWLSNGGSHFWHLGQEEPATLWEKEIDQLMRQQLTELDPEARKKLYDRVQEIAVDQLPLIYLISPNVLVGASGRLGNFKPAILDHPTLWNVEELFWRQPAAP